MANPEVEHEPWRPTDKSGIDKQTIAIVGYSHYQSANEVDHESLTNEIVQAIVDGTFKHHFFTSIRNYFGYTDHKAFWSKVYFFNFIPESIGTNEDKFLAGTEEQCQKGRMRFLRILAEEPIDKVFIFSIKGWRGFPETTLEEQAGGKCTPLVEGSDEPNWGTYDSGGRKVLTCGFRHPLGASGEELTQQVQTFLKLGIDT